MLVRMKDVTKEYGNGAGGVTALDQVSLTVTKGSFTAVMGPSGSGKSTLLHIIGGLVRPTSGTVEVDGIRVAELDREALSVFRRRKTGFVFQEHNLMPLLNVYDNVRFSLDLDHNPVDKEYVNSILARLRLDNKREAMPDQLSGGQQQCVAVARALASKPALLLADEPTGSLDSRSGQEVLSLLKMANQAYHQTIIMITHNEEIAQLADRVIHMRDGKIV